MSIVLLDDHLLLRVLLDDEPSGLRDPDATLATTGLWYHRLARALTDDTVVGSLSRRIGAVTPELAAAALGAVVELPDDIVLLSLRTLGGPMAALLRAGVRLNLLSLEALAAAHHLGADILLAPADENPSLRAAAERSGVRVRVVDG